MTGLSTYYQPIYRFINQRVSNFADAEDLTQEVFYKFIRSMKQKTVENPKSCLYTIAKHTIVDYYRAKKMILNITESEWKEKEVLIPDGLNLTSEQCSQLKDYLLEIINELPLKYQQIIRLSELEGVAQKDIAEELGLNYATVRSRVQRGRNILKKTISDCCEIIQGGKGSIIGYKPTSNSRCGFPKGKIHYL